MSEASSHVTATVPAVADGARLRQFLTFYVGNEMFAMPIEPIREIIEFRSLTEVPMTPEFFRGVVNLRGSVVPVIDLALRIGRAQTPVMRRACIIIVELRSASEVLRAGVMVAGVRTVTSVALSQIEARPSFGTMICADFIEGMIKVNEQFVVALDIQKTLSPDDMALLIGSVASNKIHAG